MRTLVVGLGNPILTDDGIGIHVVRALARGDHDGPPVAQDVSFAEASVGGLRLLEVIAGYDRVVLVDAIQTRNGNPGDLHRLSPDDLQAPLHTGSTHDLSLPDALALGQRLGMAVPKEISIVAIEAEDVLSFGEALSPAAAAAVPRAVEMVLSALE